jgi:hypothetical protein
VSNATKAQGTLLKIGDGAGSENFVTVAEVMDITGPGLKSDIVDVTNMDSPQGFHEKLPTLLDAGQIKFTVNFIPTNATQSYSSGMLRDWYNRTVRHYKIVWSDVSSTTWGPVSAYIADFSVKAMVKNQLVADVTLDISGVPNLA